MKNRNDSHDADWNAQFLFLRSKSSPSLYFLNNKGHGHLQKTGAAIQFDSVNLANELLRLDLRSFFSELAGWHLYYRKCSPLITVRNFNNNRVVQRTIPKRTQYLRELESTPYLNGVEDLDYESLTFDSHPDYFRWIQAKPHRSPDFRPVFNSILDRCSIGQISASTRKLLRHACSICLNNNGLAVPDPFYYSYLFGTVANECSAINELLALVCSDNDLIRRHDAADQFNSYLHLEKHASEQTMAYSSFQLTEEPDIKSYTPDSTFANLIGKNTPPYLASHDLCYLQSIYAILLQTYLGITQTSHFILEKMKSREPERLIVQAYINITNNRLEEIDEDLNSVINLCSDLLISSNKHAFTSGIDTLTYLLDELRKLRTSDYFQSIAQSAKDPLNKPSKEISEEDRADYREFSHRRFRLNRAACNKSRGPLYRQAALNDHEAALEQIKRHAIIRHAENTCLLETEWSFSRFYARLLSELINCGKIPIRCKSCGSLFFPTGSNSQYCDRFDPTTNLYCNPRLNEKKRLGRKAPHGTAINLHKKAETAKQLNEKRRHAYFAELEEFVDHEIGPIYFKSTLITDELYQSWRTAINTPKNQPKTKTPEQLAFPHPVIWEDQIIEGNQEIAVYLNQYAYPALRDKLDQSAKSSKWSCTAIDKPTIRFGGWKLRLFDLLRLLVSINNDKEHIQNGPIPVPGLGPMDDFTPDRSPLEPWPEGKERLLRFPSSGKESLILFEIIDDNRSKQLHLELTHTTSQPQPEEHQRQLAQEGQCKTKLSPSRTSFYQEKRQRKECFRPSDRPTKRAPSSKSDPGEIVDR